MSDSIEKIKPKGWEDEFSPIVHTSDGAEDYFDKVMRKHVERDKALHDAPLSKAWSAKARVKHIEPGAVVQDLLEIRDAVHNLLKVHGLPPGTPVELALLGKKGAGCAGFYDIGSWNQPYVLLDSGVYNSCKPEEVMDVYAGIGLHECDHILETREFFVRMKDGRLSTESRRYVWENLLEDERIEECGRRRSKGFAPYYHALKRFLFEKKQLGNAIQSWADLPDKDKALTIFFAFIRVPYLLSDEMRKWATIKGTGIYTELRKLFPKVVETEAEVELGGANLEALWKRIVNEYTEAKEESPEDLAKKLLEDKLKSEKELMDEQPDVSTSSGGSGESSEEKKDGAESGSGDASDSGGSKDVGSSGGVKGRIAEETIKGGGGAAASETTAGERGDVKQETVEKSSTDGKEAEEHERSEVEDEKSDDLEIGSEDSEIEGKGSEDKISDEEDGKEVGRVSWESKEIGSSGNKDDGQLVESDGGKSGSGIIGSGLSEGEDKVSESEDERKEVTSTGELDSKEVEEKEVEENFGSDLLGEGVGDLTVDTKDVEKLKVLPSDTDSVSSLPDAAPVERIKEEKELEKLVAEVKARKLVQELADISDAEHEKELKAIDNYIRGLVDRLDENTENVEGITEIMKHGGIKKVKRGGEEIKKAEEKRSLIEEDREHRHRFSLIDLFRMIEKMETITSPLSAEESFKMAEMENERMQQLEGWSWTGGDSTPVNRRTIMVCPNPMDEDNRKRYDGAHEKVKEHVDQLRAIFRMRKGVKTVVQTELKEGKLHRKMLARAMETDRLYQREYEKRAQGLRIKWLLDESGSMGSAGYSSFGGKADKAIQLGVLAVESLEGLQGIENEIYSFTSCGSGHTDCLIKCLHGRENPDKYSVGGYHYGAENYDHIAIQTMTRFFLDDRRRTKGMKPKELLIVISDGSPLGSGYGGSEAIASTRLAVQQAEKKGIYVLGIAIEAYAIERMYKHYLKYTDMKTFIQKMQSLITQFVRSVSA